MARQIAFREAIREAMNEEMRRDDTIGRSEAFRRAMLSLLRDTSLPWAAHPSVWAPFIVVGEGGAEAPR